MRVVLIEDDPTISVPLADGLMRSGFDVVAVATAADGLAAVDGSDLVLLDLGLPDLDGSEVCRRIRQTSSVPIIVISARGDEIDRVLLLESGADDYVVKPFAYAEVAARLRALARRAEPGPRRAEPKLSAGAITLDEASRRVTVNGANVDLSPREFSLLEALLRHAGQTLTRDQLLDHAWPFSVAVTPNAVDAYVHYLRTKLGAAGSQVETVRGVGYRLGDG